MHLTLKQRSHQARGGQRPAAASALRRLSAALQRRAAASGAGHACARRRSTCRPPRPMAASPLDYPLHDWTGTVTHCGRICFKTPQDQSESGLCGTERRREAGRRAHLARHLHALRSRLLRRRDLPTRADRESLRSESVTYVSGINCHPCDRNGPGKIGGAARI